MIIFHDSYICNSKMLLAYYFKCSFCSTVISSDKQIYVACNRNFDRKNDFTIKLKLVRFKAIRLRHN